MQRGLYYHQDVIAPQAIAHGLDFGDPHPDGTFGHCYNYLDYSFAEGDAEIDARHYLDEPDSVSIRSNPLPLTDFSRRVLMFLAMRYDAITILTNKGYVPLPTEIVTEIAAAVAVHMKEAGPS